MADFLDEKRREIAARRDELRPLVDEYARLEAAAAALGSVPPASPAGRAPRRTARRQATPGAPRAKAGGARPRGRPKGSGTRRDEALQLVKAGPGITIPQLAAKMGIKQNYLYRVLAGLADDGLVTKSARGWYPSNTSAA